ncbi:hypothetical protein HZA55_07270 [Candidatus Poribacteria bacterium]|nr:hypothetical protein [Candidatus Poribacteria bacterium]
MVEHNLQIDKTVSFSEDVSILEEIRKKNIAAVSPEIFEKIVPTKNYKYLNILIGLFLVIIAFQLNYIVGEYSERDNEIKQRDKALRDKEYNEKLIALKTQSNNFTRDAKHTIEKINETIKSINELRKDNLYIPESFNNAKKLYDSAIFHINQAQYEKASKLAISSINAGNVAMTYAETELDELRKKLDNKAKEEEDKQKELLKIRENTRIAIDKAKTAVKSAAGKEAEKYSPITFGEAKRLLLDAAKLFNETIDTKDIKKIDETLKIAQKSEKLAKLSEEESEKNKKDALEETKRKSALEEALRIREIWEKSQKKKAAGK